MKIVSVMTTDSSGGAEFAAVELLEALRLRGHETVMLSDQPGIARETGVKVADIAIGPKLSTRSWVSLGARSPILLKRLHDALRAQQPYDVLMVHYKKEQLLAALLPASLRSTTVWAEWGPVPFPLRRGLPHRAFLAAASRTALITAVSEGTRRSLANVGIDDAKLVVVPNALRTEEIRYSEAGRERVRAELGIPANAFVVGCISRFHYKKRNDVVIDAVRSLEDERVHLIMAGSGEEEQRLRELAHPLGERAHFIPTPGAHVADVLSAFDVSVFCPSPTEGAPRAVILGMLASRPCLATGPEGVADMISPEIGGIASPENDPRALRELIAPYIGDRARIERQGTAARAHAESTYAAPVVAEFMERLLDDAIAAPRARQAHVERHAA